MIHNSKREMTICIVGTFIFLTVIMYLSPLSSDDYRLLAYDFSGLKDAFLFNLHYANGRILGNYFGYVIANSVILKVLVKAIIITSLIFMIPAVVSIKKWWAYLASLIFLLALDPEIFGQVYSWTAGFNNYVPPIFLICLIILLIERFADKTETVSVTVLLVLAVSILSIFSQLYLELNTLVNTALVIVLVVVNQRNGEKQRFRLYLVCLFSLIIGAIVMFILPKIFNASSPSYRGLRIGSISVFIRSTASNGIKLFTYLENNTLICCSLLFICIFLLIKKKGLFPKPVFMSLLCSEAASLAYIISDGLFRETMWLGHTIAIKQFVAALIGAITFINTCVVFARVYGKKGVKLYVLLGLALLSLGPMLIVHPVPKRTFFLGYIFILALVLSVMDSILEEYPLPSERLPLIKHVMVCTSIGVGLFLISMFIGIHTLDVDREKHIVSEMKNNAETIEIYRIPSKYVYWDEEWCFTYYYYYETPKDIQFEAVDYITWLGRYEDVSSDD